MKPYVVLIGPPGAGKSSVGRRLSELLDLPFADTDEIVEAQAGKAIPDIFIEDGEPRFREFEAAAVNAALTEHAGVLSLGGGAIMNPETREALGSHRVVFLTVGLAAASPRVGFSRNRPLLIGSPRKQWLQLFQQREPLYLEVADLTVATDELTVNEVAEVVLSETRRMDEVDGHGHR